MANKTKIIPACGYHPSHLVSPSSEDFISVPSKVKFVEFGLAELERYSNKEVYKDCSLSLHIARSPICEDEKTQNTFINFLSGKIQKSQNKIASVGFHLTGSRNEGIGKLGFSSHYKNSIDQEHNAIRFIKKVKKETGVPAWIENANFYSSSAKEVIENWESVRRILESTDAQLIFDLTHCYIESHNLGLNPEFIFGLVPWNRVVEIHISGYVTGGDGALHDGHSQPIKPEIWKLLTFVLERFVTSDEVIVNIEHTDLSWRTRKTEYIQDFSHLMTLNFVTQPASQFSEKQFEYAISNIHRIISLKHPEIQTLLIENGFDQKKVLRDWIHDFLQGDLRLVFSKNEVPEAEFENTVAIVDGFMDYIRKNLA